MRDERNVYGTFKFFVKYRLGQQFRWRVFWFNLSGKLFAGYWHSKRSQIGPNIVDICSELWGKVSHFRMGYSFAAIFFRKFQWLNFMHGSIACPSIWWQILRRDLWETRQPAQKNHLAWYPGKSADGYKSWQNTEEFPAHFIHFIKPDTFVKSEKHLKPIHRDQKLDPEISHSTWEETNLFKYCIPTVCRYITWN